VSRILTAAPAAVAAAAKMHVFVVESYGSVAADIAPAVAVAFARCAIAAPTETAVGAAASRNAGVVAATSAPAAAAAAAAVCGRLRFVAIVFPSPSAPAPVQAARFDHHDDSRSFHDMRRTHVLHGPCAARTACNEQRVSFAFDVNGSG